MDKHNFYIGESFDAYDYFGAHIEKKGATFRVYAPNAEKVCLIGEFNDWKEEEMFQLEQSGIFELVQLKAEAGMMYKYVIYSPHSRVEHCDPYGFSMELRPNFASIVSDLTYRFTDKKWMESRTRCYDKPMNIYEMHMGSWKHNPKDKENGWYKYDELIPLLIPYLKENGYTHVEFMPLSEHPFDGSWGYQNTGFFAPTSRYGTPLQLKKLINALHKEGIGAVIDFVPVHFAADYYGLKEFDGTRLYEHPACDVGNSEWGTYNFAYSRGEVCSFIQSAANFWLEEYHFDGIRMDAISRAIYWRGDPQRGVNNEAVAFYKKMNEGLHRLHPNVFICAEDSTSFPGVTNLSPENSLDFDYKWDMGWMNDTLDYFRSFPWSRKDQYDKLTFSMMYFYNERYLLPFSHDETVHGKATIVQKMNGEYENKFSQARAMYMYMYIHPGKKLNFMGNELGMLREWDEKQEQDWDLLKYPMHDSFRNYIFELNKLYEKYDAFYYDYDPLNFEWADISDREHSVYSIVRKSRDYDILAIFNFDGIERKDYELKIPGKAKLLLCSDWDTYSGKTNHKDTIFTQKEDVLGNLVLKMDIPAFSGTMFYIENRK